MEKPRTPSYYRRRGAIRCLIGFLACVGLIALIVRLIAAGYMDRHGVVVVFVCFPFVVFVVGLLEVLFGRPPQELGDAWAALKSWQRAALGLAISLLVLLLITECFDYFFE